MQTSKFFCLVAIATLTIASSVSAATINFGTASDFTGSSDVNLNGQTTLDRAYDFGAGTLHINGITFNDFGSQSSDTASNLGGSYGGYGNGGQSGDYGTMLSNAYYQDGGSGSITFNNLHAGDNYSIGVWVNDSRQPGCCGTGRELSVSGTTGGTTGELLFNQPSGPSGQFVYGTFTATGTSQTLNLDLVGANSGNNQINGVLLSYSVPTPEPSSLVLCGLGAAGLLVAARRRSRKA